MKEYRFEDLSLGMDACFVKEIKKEMLEQFKEITEDINPLHCDKEFANSQGYPDRVNYGMLTASFISTLGGVYLPGKYCLIQSVETMFLRPVYVGDVLKIYGTVVELHESVRQATIKIVITNQNGVKVLRGKMKVGFLNDR